MEESSVAEELLAEGDQLPPEPPSRRAGGARSPAREYGRFFSAFVRHPLVVGGVAPSSRRLAAALMASVDLAIAKTVVELGAGTGAITRALRRRIGRHLHLIAFELPGSPASRMQREFRNVHVLGESAEHLRHHLDRPGHPEADCLVSSLPWGSMSGGLQKRTLNTVLASLKPGGAFSAVAYLHASGFPSSRKFRRKLEHNFRRVASSPIVQGNLPPGFVYHCI